jgi:hypothetical protein
MKEFSLGFFCNGLFHRETQSKKFISSIRGYKGESPGDSHLSEQWLAKSKLAWLFKILTNIEYLKKQEIKSQ